MSGHGRCVARILVPLCVLLLGLTACDGAGGRRASASAAATAFERALRSGDAAALCGALAPQTRREVEDAEKKPCKKAITAQDLSPGGRLGTVDVHGRQARAVLASDTLFLSQFPGGWKIVAAGCRPSPGRPYQCSVKGG